MPEQEMSHHRWCPALLSSWRRDTPVVQPGDNPAQGHAVERPIEDLPHRRGGLGVDQVARLVAVPAIAIGRPGTCDGLASGDPGAATTLRAFRDLLAFKLSDKRLGVAEERPSSRFFVVLSDEGKA